MGKSKARLARKRAQGEDGAKEAMDIDNTKEEEDKDKDKKDDDDEDAMDIDDKEAPDDKKKPLKKQPELNTFRQTNPSRVTKKQSALCEFDLNQRYRPVSAQSPVGGVVMLTDSTPEEEEEVFAVKTPSLDAEDEAEPPEPFEWAPPGHDEYVEPLPPVESSGSSSSDTKSLEGGEREG